VTLFVTVFGFVIDGEVGNFQLYFDKKITIYEKRGACFA
jgi:hypothetical protein